MNLKDLGIDGRRRKTLVVLGAGASRGASFVTDDTLLLPPLDSDFFQQVARMHDFEAARRPIEFVRSEYGREVGLSMEQFFSEADYTNRFHTSLNVDRGPMVKRYASALSDFMQILPELLNRTTSRNCAYHDAVARRLHSSDCVISSNCDCLMDRDLSESKRG